MKSVRLGRGKYTFKDLDTARLHTVKADNARDAVKNLNKSLCKKVNYSFYGWKKTEIPKFKIKGG